MPPSTFRPASTKPICAHALALSLCGMLGLGCGSQPVPAARIGWTELPASARHAPTEPGPPSPAPTTPPVEVHAEGLVAAPRLAVVRATLAYFGESSRTGELWLPAMNRLEGCAVVAGATILAYTRCLRVTLVEATGGTYLTLDAFLADGSPRPANAVADAAPPILARIETLAAKDEGKAASPLVGVMACGFVDEEGHAGAEGTCWFGRGEGPLLAAWVSSKAAAKAGAKAGEDAGADTDTAWISTPGAEAGAGLGVSIHGLRVATKADIGRPFSLVSFSPNGGLGASDEFSSAVVLSEQRVDGTKAFPLVVDEVMTRLRAAFDAHAATQKAAIAAGMTRSSKLLLEPGTQATGPRWTKDGVVAKWIPGNETLRVKIHRAIRDGSFLNPGCAAQEDPEACLDGAAFGVDLEVTYDVDKKGIVRRTEAGKVVVLGEEPDEPVPAAPS